MAPTHEAIDALVEEIIDALAGRTDNVERAAWHNDDDDDMLADLSAFNALDDHLDGPGDDDDA